MAAIMTLQGPSAQLLGSGQMAQLLGWSPPSTTLAGLRGITDTITSHWFVVLVGLAIGGYIADKHLVPRGGAWGRMQAQHSRTKALHGARRRR